MEQETLFTASKWVILKILSEGSFSPIELAARSNTSVANISQQLRLLEMAGLIKSERISNRDKGQPRVLYSLAGNHSFLITTASDFTEKKLFELSAYNKIILRIWFFPKKEVHYFLEKAFWTIEKHLPIIDALAIIEEDDSKISFLLLTRKEGFSIKDLSVTRQNGEKRTMSFIIQHPDSSDIKKVLGGENSVLYPLYDPGNIITSLQTPKGDDDKKW